LQRRLAPLALVLAAAGGRCAAALAADKVTNEDRQFWSFRRTERPILPAVRDHGRARTSLDLFVLAKLEEKGSTLAQEADPRTLIRRLALDLTGMPPSPEEVEEFLADRTPDACERVVDRLLASPRFGERWARHWLDVAGYVDTVGFDVDADNIITSEGKWRYRDYVIRAFNEDKPYDRFLTEQLAGDEMSEWRTAPKLTAEMRELLVATGFLRTAQDFTHEDVGNIPQNYYNVLNDTLEIVGSSVLGLTLQCARCHSHKFDPVPQEDYYRLMALFTPAYNPADWKVVFPYDAKVKDLALPDISAVEKAKLDRENAEIDQRIAALNGRLEDLRRPYRESIFGKKIESLPEPIRADTRKAIDTQADKRTEIEKYLVTKFEGALKVTREEIDAVLKAPDKSAAAEIRKEIQQNQARRRTFGKIQALYDLGPAPRTFRLVRGNYTTPGAEVQPGFLRVLCESDTLATLPEQAPPVPNTTGRRVALARWLTAPGTPASSLAARVMANRIWQHLFGAGIVPSPENFGVSGEPPTHPELLEWLSAELMQNGWRIKPLIRLVVLSSVYRQSSRLAKGADAEIHLLSYMPLKRLESEAVRDAILMASGALDPTMGGPPIMLQARPDGMVLIAEKNLPTPIAKWRRSVYLLARRAFHLSLLNVFDQPVIATNCTRRDRSAVPLQSLAMLNSQFVFEQAELVAKRVADRAGPCPTEQITAAFSFVLGRPPSTDEISSCRELLERQAKLYEAKRMTEGNAQRKALIHLCHTLLNTSEFLYVP
jgi:hypothetical protein